MPQRRDDDHDDDDEHQGDDDEKTPKRKPAGDVDDKRLRETIREIVSDVLDSGDDGGAGDDDKGDAGDDDKGAPRSVAQVEDVSEDRVRRAVEKLAEEKEVRDRLTNVEKAIEKVPAKVRKLTSAIWGKAEAS